MKPYIRPVVRIKKQILLLIVAFSTIILSASYYFPKIEKNSILQNDYSKPKVIANLKEDQIETRMNEEKNFRNMMVPAYASIILSTNWTTAAKIDNQGLYSVLSSNAFDIAVIIVLLIVIIGLGFSRYYNRHQRNTFKELYNKEKELWQNQERFEITMDSLGEGVITLSLDGKVQYMNNAAQNLTGWNSREARGRDLHDIYPVINEETGNRENNILNKVLKLGVVKELANHTILISKDGKKIPVMDTGAPIFDREGKITGVVIAFQDETEKRTQSKLLKESENRLRSTLDNMLEGCQIIGIDYRYLYLNNTALQQSKFPKEKLLGKTMMECYPGIENTEMFSKLKLCMEKRISGKMENKFKYPDGSNGWFNLSFEPVPEGVFILSEDITAQKKAEEEIKLSEEKYRNLVDNALIGVYESNLDGEFSFGNKVLFETLGLSSLEGLKSTKIMELYTEPSDRKKFINAIKENGYVTNYEIDFNIKGKEIIHALISARLKGDKITGMILDITEKKNAENTMRVAKGKAEEMNRLKNNFLANMSHELRTPLIGILGYAEFLGQHIKDKELVEMVNVIINSGNRLNKTLNNILDISKIESEQQQIDLEEHNLLEPLSEQVKLFKLEADKKGITLNIEMTEEEIYAKVDIGLFESIIDNLLNNAIKYTNKGTVNLTLKREEEKAIIEIKDTGIGIPENAQERIFEPFRQASEGLSRIYEGTGLGLTLVKKYIDLMGGTISIKSKEGTGSVFTLMFPMIGKMKA